MAIVSRKRRIYNPYKQAAFIAVLLLVMTIVAAIAAWPLTAQTDPLQQQQQQLERQKTQIQQERQRLQILEQDAETNLTTLRQNLKATTEQIQASATQLNQASQTLKTLEGNLARAEETYRQRLSATVARLQVLQRQRGHSGWAVLLHSQDLNDFLDRRYRLQRLLDADRQQLIALKGTTDRLETQRNAVEQQKNRIALLNQQLLAEKSDYQIQASVQQQTIERLRSNKRALEAALNTLQQDSLNLTHLIRQRAALEGYRGDIVIIGSGQLSYPVDAPTTSEFGWRLHPILGYTRFHAGLDFGADYGTMIRATAPGYVLFADWYGGYGNTVVLDHGNGVATLYAHTEGFYVQEGQVVQRGQVIAQVGSTGLSTGPHLHFEVRVNGEPVDPRLYL
jgi:murein DD-endopeptidase MepM/ murein hydrolase activator NlpD